MQGLFEYIVLPFLTAFLIVLLTTPSFIKVAVHKRLFDDPSEERKLHKKIIPSMGGVMIFAGILFSLFIWFPTKQINIVKYLVPSVLVLLFVGAKDDIFITAATKKLLAHFLVAFIMVEMAGIRIESLHGLFGIEKIPQWASIALSIFTYIVIINAYNLIDGIDGLAGGVGFIAAAFFGIWFYMVGDSMFSVMAFSIVGALLAFLIFNFSPAKIFMGDSGSLTVGLFLAVMAVELIQYSPNKLPADIVNISKPTLAMAVLVYPLFDTIRVFTIRIFKGVSPFHADNNHIHHRLLKIGLTHRGACFVIYFINIIIVAVAVLMKEVNPSITFAVVFLLSALLLLIPFLFKAKKQIV